MSAYTHAHYSSRTAGYNPYPSAGASFQPNVYQNGHGPSSPKLTAGVHPQTGTAHSSPNGAPDFDALLQESTAQPQTDTSPSGFAQNASPAAGHQTTEFSEQDPFNAGLRAPDAPGDAGKPARDFSADSRTAGRTVNTADRAAFNANGEAQSFSFWDFLDIINPLQHIPIVSNIYRAITGDEISAPARIMGGAMYAGPIGAAAGVANSIVAEANGGQDIGDTVASFVTGKGKPVETLVDQADFAATQNNNLNITKEDIKWSQPSDTSLPLYPPRLNEEIITPTGSAEAIASPSPSKPQAASRSLPFTQTLKNEFLPSAAPTQAYPTHEARGKSGSSATPSLHLMSDTHLSGAEPRMSVAATAEERNRKEISYARQENTGSPLSRSLHEVQANAAESDASSEPIAISDKMDMHLKMIQALDKYKAMKTIN